MGERHENKGGLAGMCSGDIAVLSPHGNHLLDCKCSHCVAKYSNVPVHGPDERDCRISMALRVGWSLCLRDKVDGFSPTGYLFSSGGQKFKIKVPDRICSGEVFLSGI